MQRRDARRHRALTLTTATALGAVVLAFAPAANARGVAGLARELTELEQQARSLAIRHNAAAGAQSQLAEHRLVDAQVLYNLRDYTRAAIILLDYVTKYQSTRGYPEALFYLADSLYQKRDFLSARRYFRKIVNEVKGRYYQEALQRLIELSLHTGDTSNVASYLAALANIPQAQLKPSVPYVKGKYFYFKGDIDQAIAAFRSIPQGQDYYMQGQYFVGAALVRKKDYAGAAQVFQSLLRVQPKSSAEKHVRQLTHLALGRLFYQKNKISEAIDQYQKVSRRSKEFDTALYEICWAYVKAGKYKRALRALELLVLAQPNSPFIPQVKVLQGNLLIRLKQWGRATDLFQKTRDKFAPVHKRMKQIMSEHTDPNVFFDVLLARNLGDLAVTIQVPDIAVHWVKENHEVKRALHLVKDVRTIKEDIDSTKKLIARLERAVNSPARIKIFPAFATAKASSLEVENRITKARQRILARERALVIGQASASERAQLDQLAQERASLEDTIKKLPTTLAGYERRRRKKVSEISLLAKQVSRLGVVLQNMKAQLIASEKYFADTASSSAKGQRDSFRKEAKAMRALIKTHENELETLQRQLADARDAAGVGGPEEVAERDLKRKYNGIVQREHAALAGMRSRLSGSDAAEFDQLSGLMQRASTVDATVAAFNGRLEREVDQKLVKIKTVISQEKQLVGKYEVEATEYKGKTDLVAGGVTHQGFQKVAKRFYDIVVRADVGIIDVAWALKDEKTKEVSRLVQQQKLDLKVLDDEFKEVLKKD
ncbi:MAG: tetratricopeptide repeat protein [Myxococcales bacterium]|nr:tetratricopeptide repeat protein [Myxococcales bacterium]